MPTIESKKFPDNVQFVTADIWRIMQEKGLARRFKVIDDSDTEDTIIPTPEKIVDFVTPNEAEEASIEKILSRDEIKEALNEKGIEYNSRTSTEKLLKLLNKQ